MLGTEGGRDTDIPVRRERVQRVRKIARHGCRMREQRDVPAGQRLAQRRFFEQAFDPQLHPPALPSSSANDSE
ncbi:hypothetical protein D3C83_53520 [compost metagenome]